MSVSWRVRHIAVGGAIWVYPALPREKQATGFMFSRAPLNSNHRHRKGLVTDVSGPQRDACPSTLNPLTPAI